MSRGVGPEPEEQVARIWLAGCGAPREVRMLQVAAVSAPSGRGEISLGPRDELVLTPDLTEAIVGQSEGILTFLVVDCSVVLVCPAGGPAGEASGSGERSKDVWS